MHNENTVAVEMETFYFFFHAKIILSKISSEFTMFKLRNLFYYCLIVFRVKADCFLIQKLAVKKWRGIFIAADDKIRWEFFWLPFFCQRFNFIANKLKKKDIFYDT
jgi:hypothetical protein